MPVVVIPTCFLDRANITPDEAECRVESRTVAGVVQELFQRFPSLFERFKCADGRPVTNWFALFRDQDEDDLRDTPDLVLSEDDRIHLINLIGC
jgi:hypothetical protein